MDEVLSARVARFHERDFQTMDDELGTGPFAQLTREAEMIRVDVRDQDATDPLNADLHRRELLVQNLPRFFGLQAGIDQRVGVTVAQQEDIDMLELERHGELQPKNARGNFHCLQTLPAAKGW